MTYSFPKFIENRFQNEITKAARKCLNADNVREIPAKVSGVRIWQIDIRISRHCFRIKALISQKHWIIPRCQAVSAYFRKQSNPKAVIRYK